MPHERKIIQISTSVGTAGGTNYCYLYALCDDGTLWALLDSWCLVKNIPQLGEEYDRA